MSRSLTLALKRVLDIAAGTSGLVLLFPFFLLIAVAIKRGSRGPVFYVQERIGMRGRCFRMRKFRTMVEGAEEIGAGLYVEEDDPRITPVGKFLRRFSLDELPQLLHVVTGEMSLVGPRPALSYHVESYTEEQSRRLLMRPGMTGLSQVSGRNLLSWPERIEKDLWYVDHYSLLLDAHILLRTPGVWLSGDGLYGERKKFFLAGHDDIPVPSRRNS